MVNIVNLDSLIPFSDMKVYNWYELVDTENSRTVSYRVSAGIITFYGNGFLGFTQDKNVRKDRVWRRIENSPNITLDFGSWATLAT